MIINIIIVDNILVILVFILNQFYCNDFSLERLFIIFESSFNYDSKEISSRR
jgi:hypothetical protein